MELLISIKSIGLRIFFSVLFTEPSVHALDQLLSKQAQRVLREEHGY